VQTALIVCRFAHFAALLVLFGLYLSRDVLLRPVLSAAIYPSCMRTTRWLATAALVSAVAWLLVTGASMAGSWSEGLQPATLMLVLGHTDFGTVWLWHLSLNILLLLVLSRSQPSAGALPLLLCGLLLATVAPTGHVAMFEGVYGGLMIANQLIHLSAVAAWLGGLTLLAALMRAPAAPGQRAILRRFSGLGYVMVALIVITGLINVRAMSSTWWPVPAFSGFGLILAIKLAMVLCMLALALFNRLQLNRRELRLDWLRASIALECLFGLAALAAVSLLGTLPPVLPE
jgi:putative copper resistance protein D